MLLCIQPIFKIVTAACLFSPRCSVCIRFCKSSLLMADIRARSFKRLPPKSCRICKSKSSNAPIRQKGSSFCRDVGLWTSVQYRQADLRMGVDHCARSPLRAVEASTALRLQSESICHRRIRVFGVFDRASPTHFRVYRRWRRRWSGARIALGSKCAFRSRRQDLLPSI